jgi:hypothetical protein
MSICTSPLTVFTEEAAFKSEIAPQKFEYFGACGIHDGVDTLLDLKTACLVGHSLVTCCPPYMCMNIISLEVF